MTIEEFVKKNNGKKVDYDGVYDAQCVDLFRQYSLDVLGITEHTGSCSTSGGAKDLFLDYNKMPLEKKYFARITGKSFVPGDVLIWDECGTNKFGHVAIYLGKLNNDLIVFEQNGIAQDGAKIVLRSSERLLGGLRKK